MRTAATIVVGALVATPAHAEPRVRTSLELSWTFAARHPFGLGLSADVGLPLDSTDLVVGGGGRVDVFPGAGVQLILEPLVGAGLLPAVDSCYQIPTLVVDVRPGIALRSRGGLAATFATSVDYGEFFGGRARLGGALPLVRNPRKDARSTVGVVEDLTLSVGAGLINGTMCVVGRPLREEGSMVLAEADGSRHPTEIAASWLHQAREEHAAVAAFLRLAAELEALGAPDDLVHDCLTAADDEAEHARLCLQRAADHAEQPVALDELVTRARDFGSRSEALATLARESWHDGFVNEGRASLEARRSAAEAQTVADRAVHLQIAHEEAGHALLGARVTAWCLAA